MKKTIVLVIVFVIFVLGNSYGQSLKLHGRVLDSETRDCIQYANISIRGSYLGTCSNQIGEFILNYPDSLKNEQLVVSCIGYKKRTVSLTYLSKNDTIDLLLEPAPFLVEEVNVYSNQLSAEEIVKRVIKSLNKNYSRKPYFMKGFLRDKVHNVYDFKSVRLTEAAVEIEKDELSRKKYNDKVQVKEIRNSLNYSKRGNKIIYKIRQAFFGLSDENPIYRTLQYADYTDSKVLKEIMKSELYGYYISGTTMYGDKPIKIIDIKQEYLKFFYKKKPSNDRIYRLIRLYIDIENYAIIKSEYFLVANAVTDLKGEDKWYLFQDTVMTRAVKQYGEKNGKYYLNYASYIGKVYDQPLSGTKRHLYINGVELLINDLVINKKEFDRIKRRNLLKKDISLWDMEYTYHPEFWENYNIILDKPLDQKIKVDLEHDISLEDQFEETGSVKSKKSE